MVLQALLPAVHVTACAQDVDYRHDSRRGEEDPI
jgi:hypothetical protein